MSIIEIYKGLVMVEAKCLEITNSEDLSSKTAELELRNNSKPSQESWRAGIALHRVLLRDHHDFMIASHHPSASRALRNLASKYSMPTRMWRHGTQAFLNTLRRHGSEHLDLVQDFLSDASSNLHDLIECVPDMTDQWESILQGLEEYASVLKDLKNGEVSPHSAIPPNDFLDSESGSQSGFGYWGFHLQPTAETSGPTCAHWECARANDIYLPKFVIDALTGWLYCGQAFAWDSFNIYSKVFALLSLTAQKSQYPMAPFFRA